MGDFSELFERVIKHKISHVRNFIKLLVWYNKSQPQCLLSVVIRMPFYCCLAVDGALLQGIQIDKLLYMKWYKVFILVAWIHCFVYISNGVVTRGCNFIHLVFIISF